MASFNAKMRGNAVMQEHMNIYILVFKETSINSRREEGTCEKIADVSHPNIYGELTPISRFYRGMRILFCPNICIVESNNPSLVNLDSAVNGKREEKYGLSAQFLNNTLFSFIKLLEGVGLRT